MKPSNLQTPKPIARLRSRQILSEATPIAKHDKIVSRSLDSDFMAGAARHKRSDLIPDQTEKHDKISVRLSDSDFTAESELLLSDLPVPVASPSESIITQQESAHIKVKLPASDFMAESELHWSDMSDPATSPAESIITREEAAQLIESSDITDLDASSENYNTKEKNYRREIDLITKALEETSRSADISENSKKILDAMFDAAIEQLKGETSTKKNGLADTAQIAKVRIGTLALIIMLMWLILVRLINIWSMDGHNWPNGLPPT